MNTLFFFKNKKAGFTLIELMVATSIFMIVMLMALGTLVISSNAAKKAQALHTAMDNVNFAVESMTRSLRTGSRYYCGNSTSVDLSATTSHDCPFSSGGGSLISFWPQITDPSNPPQYAVAYESVSRSNGTTSLKRCDSATTGSGCIDIVSNEVDVQKLKFFVTGAESATDGVQPSVYILMKGVITIRGESVPFAVQTMASQRSAE